MTVFLYCFREREDLFDCYEAVSGARMHAAYFRPGGVYRDLPDAMPQYQASQHPQREGDRRELNENRQGSLLDFIEDFTERFPELRRRIRDAADRQPDLEAAHGRHRRGLARARAGAGLHRPDAARLGHRLGPAQEAALRGLRPAWISTSRSASTATATTATWCASRRCASPTASSSSASTGCAAIPGPVIADNHKVAPPPRVEMKANMEELIHHFKLFTEGMHVPEGEAYAGGRAPEGRVRRLPRLRRREQALPHEDPRAGLLRTWRRWTRWRAATCSPTRWRSSARMDIVFGEIDR